MVHRILQSKPHGIVTITQAGQSKTDRTVTRGTQPLGNRVPRPAPVPGARDQDIRKLLSTHFNPLDFSVFFTAVDFVIQVRGIPMRLTARVEQPT
jgi:hypothetical protein